MKMRMFYVSKKREKYLNFIFFLRSIGYVSNNEDILLILLIAFSSFGPKHNRSISYQEMALSPKDVERFNNFCAVNVMVLERLRIALRFACDETDVIMDHPHIEQEYNNINERWDEFDLTPWKVFIALY